MQGELGATLSLADEEEVRGWREGDDPFASLRLVGGVDISFSKEDPNKACAILTVLSFPALQVLHSSTALVEMTEPYIPGFLAFREVGCLMDRLECVRKECPKRVPQVILVDGNGILHPRGCHWNSQPCPPSQSNHALAP